MDLDNQAQIKELAERLGVENLVVVIGALDSGGAEIAAMTVTSGDPTYAGPLAGVSLRLPVYHVLEPEVRSSVDQAAYQEEVELMEMALEESVEDIVATTRKAREGLD